MGVHVCQMTSLAAIQSCYDAVTVNAAKILHLDKYGIAEGNWADLVLLQAADPFEAIRLKATRLMVLRRGKIIARSAERTAELVLPGRPGNVSLNFVPGSVTG